MHINRPWKIIIGAATAFFFVMPFTLVIPIALIPIAGELGLLEEFRFSAVIFPWMFAGICLVNVLTYAGVGFYLIHNIKNREGNETIRIILGLGTFFMPFIALPIYYFIYIWPDRPPQWALEGTEINSSSRSSEPPGPSIPTSPGDHLEQTD